MRRFYSVLLCVMTLLMVSCKEEVSVDAGQLSGHWAVFNAERNGRPTALLNGAIFQFQEDGMLHTNITGEELAGRFEVEKNQIQFNAEQTMLFQVNGLSGDTLSLGMTIQSNQFLLDLHRTTTESH